METILVPLDGSPFSEYALTQATALAERSGANLLLAYVHTPVMPVVTMVGATSYDPSLDLTLREGEQRYLDRTCETVRRTWNGSVQAELLDAPIDRALIEYAVQHHVDLMVMSTHGRSGLQRAWLGSVTDRLLRQSPVPLLLVRPTQPMPDHRPPLTIRHVLIPLDGSQLSEHIIEQALMIGKLSDADYRLIRAIEPHYRSSLLADEGPPIDVPTLEEQWAEAEEYLNTVARNLQAQGYRVTTHVHSGQPAEAILTEAYEQAIDMIAMSTHGRSGLSRMLLGSVADKVIRAADMPLLVYRPPESTEGAHLN